MNEELYHFGVKGMKWGVRRKKQNTQENNKAKKYYPTQNDRIMYGNNGAERVAKLRNKGYTRKQATKKVTIENVVKTSISSVGLLTIGYLIDSGKGKQLISNGKEAVTKMFDKHFNNIIYDQAGNVLKRYHARF